jgi:hypothetical protein
MRYTILTFVFCSLFLNHGEGVQTQTPLSGNVNGIAVNENNEPVRDMKVSLNWAGSGLEMGMTPTAETSADGRFAFVKCNLGAYFASTGRPHYLDTGIETHGYVDTQYDFFQSRSNIRVVLDSAHPTVPDLRIVVGPKGGTISGTVADAATGRALKDTSFRFWKVRNQTAWVEFNPVLPSSAGRYQSLMPSGFEIAMSVSSLGYETWYCSDAKTGENNFTLQPGSTKTILIRMTPQVKLGPSH